MKTLRSLFAVFILVFLGSGFLLAQPTARIVNTFPTVCEGGSTNLAIELLGVPPFTFRYNDGSSITEVTNIQASDLFNSLYPLAISPASSRNYTLTYVRDGNNVTGTVSGSEWVNVTSITSNTPVATPSSPVCSGASVTVQSYYISCGNPQWQLSIGNTSSFADIPGAVFPVYTSTYTNSTSSFISYYLRLKMSSGAVVKYTSPVQIIVNPPVVAGTINPPATSYKCSGDLLTLTLTGSTGNNVTWEESSDNITFTSTYFTGTTFNWRDYSSSQNVIRKYYRARVQDGNCVLSAYTNSIAIDWMPLIGNSLIYNLTKNVCDGQSVTLNIDLYNGGQIQWYKSTDNLTFSPIPGATGISLTDGPLLNTGASILHVYYKAETSSGGVCSKFFTGTVDVSVFPQPLAGIASASASQVCAFNSNGVALYLAGYSGNITWQKFENGAYVDFFNSDVTPFTTPPLLVPYGEASREFKYRAKISRSNCASVVYSNEVTVVSYNRPSFPSFVGGQYSAQACDGDPGLTINLNQSPDFLGTVQWFSSTDNISYSPIAGATGFSYQTPAFVNTGSTSIRQYYRPEVSYGACPNMVGNPFDVTVNVKPVAGAAAANMTEVCSESSNNKVTLSLTGYTGNITWQYAIDGGVYQDFFAGYSPVFTTNALVINEYNVAQRTYTFRAKVTTSVSCATVYSNVLTVTVFKTPSSLSYPYGTMELCDGGSDPVTLQVNSTFGTIQWTSSSSASGPFTPIVGAIGSVYTLPPRVNTGSSVLSTYYRPENINGVCPVAVGSSYTDVRIHPQPLGGMINSSASELCGVANANVNLSISGHRGTITWQKSEDGGAFVNFQGNIVTANSGILSTNGSASRIFKFRAMVSNFGCAPVYSNELTVTVYGIPSQPGYNGTWGPYDLCDGASNAPQLVVQNSGFIGSLRWKESNSAGGPYTLISGANGFTYQTPLPVNTTNAKITKYYVAEAYNGLCPVKTASAVAVNIYPKPVSGALSAPATEFCGSSNTTITLSGHNGTSILWEMKSGTGSYYILGNSGTSQPSGTLAAYSPNAEQVYTYRATISNPTCAPVTTPELVLRAYAIPTVAFYSSIPYCKLIPSGSSITFTGNVLGKSYQWQIKYPGAADFVNYGAEITIPAGSTSSIAPIGPLSYSAAGLLHQVRLVVKNGTCANVLSTVQDIMVYPAVADFTLTSSTTAVCGSPQSATLTVTNSRQNSTQLQKWNGSAWVNMGSSITFNAVDPVITFSNIALSTSPVENRFRTVATYTYTNCTAVTVASNSFSIFDYPAKPAAPGVPTGPASSCITTPVSSYSVGSVVNATSYVWTLNPASSGAVVGNGTTVQVNWNTSFTGNASLVVAAQNACGISGNSTALTITRNALPTVNFTGLNTSYCFGTSATLLVPTPTGGTFTGSSLITNVSGTSFNPAALGVASVTYTYTSPSTGCTNSVTRNTTVYDFPTVNAGPDQTVCSGQALTLTASGNAVTYSWNNGVQNGVSFTPVSTQTYTLTGSSNGCSRTDQVLVTVNPLPVLSMGTLSNAYCKEAPDVILAPSPASGILTIDGLTGNVFSPASLNPGPHVVSYSYTHPLTACSNSLSQTVTVHPAVPAPNAGVSPLELCGGTNFTVSIGNQTGYSTFISGTPDGAVSVGGGGNQSGIQIAFKAGTASGNLDITIRDNATLCQRIQTFPVVVLPTPSTPLVTGTMAVCPGATTSLSASAFDATDFVWLSTTPPIGVIATGANFTTPAINATTTYEVKAVGSNGCRSFTPALATITLDDCAEYALRFNGSNQYARVPNNSLLNLGTGPFTMEANIKADPGPENGTVQVFMSKRDLGSDGFMFGLYHDRLWVQLGGPPNHGYEVGPRLRDGECHHVAVTRNAAGGLFFYVDGNLTHQTSSLGNINSVGPLFISFDDADFGDYYKGEIEDLRLWNVFRTQQDINNLSAVRLTGNEAGLVANWRMNSAQQLLDQSVNQLHGRLGSTTSADVNDPSRVLKSCVNGGLSFNGSTDRVNIQNNANLNLGTGSFTMEAFVTPSVGGSSTQVIMSNRSAGNFSGFMFGLLSGRFWMQLNGFNHAYDQTPIITDNACHHVVATRDAATNRVTFYVDGVQYAQVTNGLNINSASSWVLGFDRYDNGDYFNGGVDEIRVWNRALSLTEINQYNNVRLTGIESGLISNWRFGNIGSQNVYDLSNTYSGFLGTAATVETSDPSWITVNCSGSYLKKGATQEAPLEENSTWETQAYPNPFSDQLNLILTGLEPGQSVHIRITDLQGNVVFEQETTDRELSIPNAWPSGMYLVNLQSAGTSLVHKVVKIN